jgi:hypothetical protein
MVALTALQHSILASRHSRLRFRAVPACRPGYPGNCPSIALGGLPRANASRGDGRLTSNPTHLQPAPSHLDKVGPSLSFSPCASLLLLSEDKVGAPSSPRA